MIQEKMAGMCVDPSMLVDVDALCNAYYAEKPDPAKKEECISFGTSGHRGSAFLRSFNEWHIFAITQAIFDYRSSHGITGPLFLGKDTHALSEPAYKTAIEVLGANGVEAVIAEHDEYTPTPVISHAILTYNRGRSERLGDGIVITPSHNPPDEGGFKYNPPNGGPADTHVTSWIEKRANELLAGNVVAVKRMPYAQALALPTLHRKDFRKAYIDDLPNVIDMRVIADSKVALAVDPLGGAGVHYWEPIQKQYGLNLTVTNTVVDPTFRFMRLDWDGKIRMDPSSPYVMQGLVGLKDRFQVAFSCDTDHDRHGVVTKSSGLLPSNHYLAAMIYYLFQHRPQWAKSAGIGKTVVSSEIIDRIAKELARPLYEVPVGFKWYADGLMNHTLAFGGEESAGATFVRFDGSPWSTDKDGIIAALCAAEITARLDGKDPGLLYRDITEKLGDPQFSRIDAEATKEQKEKLKKLRREDVTLTTLVGEKIEEILTTAPGNGMPIGGVKVKTKNNWFAVRPSGTEDIYKIYAESFRGKEALQQVVDEAKGFVERVIGG